MIDRRIALLAPDASIASMMNLLALNSPTAANTTGSAPVRQVSAEMIARNRFAVPWQMGETEVQERTNTATARMDGKG